MKKILQGLGVSKGKATGTVRIIKKGQDYSHFQPGEILVTRLTDPTMVPIMGKAVGIICEIGGMTSHPSIVSRELGIPCIVAVDKATEILNEGDLVEMCGETGEIALLENKSAWRLRWE